MKTFRYILPIIAILMFSSCVSIKVASDYDREANFNDYKTFAFYKTGIDKAQISDLDKKRILRAIDTELQSRGLVKSNDPDILISIFTKEKERVNIYNSNFGYGWGWHPWYWGANHSNISTSTVGSLYIDVIQNKNKELVWQGKGSGSLNFDGDIARKEEKIKEFVSEILKQYPPEASTK